MEEIEITAEHIARGIRKTMHDCPIALALRERGSEYVSVGSIIQDGHDSTYDMETQVEEWIARYDAGYPVKPFTLQLGRNDSLGMTSRQGWAWSENIELPREHPGCYIHGIQGKAQDCDYQTCPDYNRGASYAVAGERIKLL